MKPVLALIGDGIENPHNAITLMHAAQMFESSCRFRDRAGLADRWPNDLAGSPEPVTVEDLIDFNGSIVALENAEQAVPIYGFRAGSNKDRQLVVGNERRGISPDVLRLADACVKVPMRSRRVNTLNVAAASAVGLYYLARGGGGKLLARAHPERKRPELLLIGGHDHIELGSTIRSAAAFGWQRAFVEDRAAVWFRADRVTRSEGRGAARRGKNSIRLVPTTGGYTYAFEHACIVSVKRGEPLGRVNLARGRQQIVVLPDEGSVDIAAEELGRLARNLQFARIELPVDYERFVYHYRLAATIALAEISRQVGARARGAPRRRQPGVYNRQLETLLDESGETVFLDDLVDY